MYANRTDKELIELLSRHNSLTFESQLSLSKEIESRNLRIEKSDLNNTIGKTFARIKKLEYLKDIGFKAEFSEKGVVVTRTLSAMLTDVAAVISGFLFLFLGLFGIGSLSSVFINGGEINVISLAISLGMISLIPIGVKFLSGFKRLFDFSGFYLSNHDGTIILKKRFDLKLERVTKGPTDLSLEEYNDEMILRLGNYEIFNSNSKNIVQRMTLEQLALMLKEK